MRKAAFRYKSHNLLNTEYSFQVAGLSAQLDTVVEVTAELRELLQAGLRRTVSRHVTNI